MKVGFNFSKAITPISRIREMAEKYRLNAAIRSLSRLKPAVVSFAEQLIRQRVLGSGAVAKALHLTKSSILIPELVNIPAGMFMMGSMEYYDEQPIRQVKLSSFKMGKYEVTNEEFRAFLAGNGRDIPRIVADGNFNRHPVVNVSWDEATEYCKWLGKVTGREFRLPTEAEWEYAARGPEGLKYPWGNEFDASKATFNAKGTTPVDAHPEGKSPFGIYDLCGNVHEWIEDWYANEYDANDVIDPKGPVFTWRKALRGISWETGSHFLISGSFLMRSSCRGSDIPSRSVSMIGFRIVEEIK